MTVMGRELPVSNARPVRGARAYGAGRPRSGPDAGTRRHAGVDLAAPPGTPVVAPEAGRVVVVARSTPAPPGVSAWPATPPWSGYGPGLVVVEGQSGRHHLLSHLAWPVLVSEGAGIFEGEPVGTVSHLAHAHWEVRTRLRRPSAAVMTHEITLDPLAWLDGRDVPLGADEPEPDDVERHEPPELAERAAPNRRRGGLGWVLFALAVGWALSRKG